MPEIDHLLPPNATALERALSIVDGERLALFPPQVLLRLLDPLTCPAAFLPALAFELSVEEEWDLAVTEAQQRALLANAYALNAKKGTPFAIKRGLAVIGYPGATLVEGKPEVLHDGIIRRRNGRFRYNSPARWALFDVEVPLADDQSLDASDRARVLRGIETWQRAACYLDVLRAVVRPVVVRDAPAAIVPVARVALEIPVRRDTPRDGRYRRGALRTYRYDGLDRHDGSVPRDGARLVAPTIRFGVQQVDLSLRVGVTIAASRGPTLRFDGAALRDGSLRRGHDGAIIRLGPEPVVIEQLADVITRPPALRFDGVIQRDGTYGRAFNGALVRFDATGTFSSGFDEGFA